MFTRRAVSAADLITAWHSTHTIEELSAALGMSVAAIHNAWSDLKSTDQLPRRYRTLTGKCSNAFTERQRRNPELDKKQVLDVRARVNDIAKKDQDPLLARLSQGMR